jgi:hypothetical protein
MYSKPYMVKVWILITCKMCTLFSSMNMVYVFSFASVCLNIIRLFIICYLAMTHNSVRMELIIHKIFTCDPPLILMGPLKGLSNINCQWILGVAWLEIHWLVHSFWQHLTAANHLHFLMNKLKLLMVDMLLETMFSTFFQHEGEPQHFDQQVMAYLNQHYRNQGIS